jgi:hypothetical protein
MAGADLLAPPAALMAALAGMRQGLGLPCQAEKAAMADYLLDFVNEADKPALLAYLDALLADPRVSDEAVRALFDAAGPRGYFDEAGQARLLLQDLQRALRGT